jgi:hypothetical protein
MNCDQLIDAMVAHINTNEREPALPEDVPVALRVSNESEPSSDESRFTDWQIVAADNFARIANLEQRLGFPFPPSFRSLVCRYRFPEFEFGPIVFFSNTGESRPRDLELKIFADRAMSPQLLSAGYLQIGNPWSGVYDPICIKAQPEGVEGPVVEMCHESLLCNEELVILEELSPSFLELVRDGLSK